MRQKVEKHLLDYPGKRASRRAQQRAVHDIILHGIGQSILAKAAYYYNFILYNIIILVL